MAILLKSFQWFCQAIEFACSAIILGIYSYYLATLKNHGYHIDTYIRAVEGISGAACLYLIFALLLVCCLGGLSIFAFLALILDIAFLGAFIYIAWENRHGADSCRGYVRTPFGNGQSSSTTVSAPNSKGITDLPSLHTACKLETAVFAVALVAIFFFLISAFLEYALYRSHKKEKAFGPGPNNGYTAGSPRRKFWQRKPKNDTYATKEEDTLPHHQTPADFRPSYATDNTAVATEQPQVYNKYGNNSTMAGAHYNGANGEAPVHEYNRTGNF